MAMAPVPTLLVLGFEGSGRTSFVNSVWKSRFDRNGLLGCMTSPPSPTTEYLILHAFEEGDQGEGGEVDVDASMQDLFRLLAETKPEDMMRDVFLRIVDSPPASLEGNALSKILKEGVSHRMGPDAGDNGRLRVPIHCVVITARFGDEENVAGVGKLADLVRKHQLPLVVVVTNKDRASDEEELEEFASKVSRSCRTRDVFCFANHVRKGAGTLEEKETSKDDDRILEALFMQVMGYVFSEQVNDILYKKRPDEPASAKKHQPPQLQKQQSRVQQQQQQLKQQEEEWAEVKADDDD